MDEMWLFIVGLKLAVENEAMLFAEKWIELEIITLSKLSEAQKLYIWEEEGK